VIAIPRSYSTLINCGSYSLANISSITELVYMEDIHRQVLQKINNENKHFLICFLAKSGSMAYLYYCAIEYSRLQAWISGNSATGRPSHFHPDSQSIPSWIALACRRMVPISAKHT